MKRNKRSEKRRWKADNRRWDEYCRRFFDKSIEQILADYDSVAHGVAPKTTLDAGA